MNKYSKLINDINYDFKDCELLETSLTHSSFNKNKKNFEKLLKQELGRLRKS